MLTCLENPFQINKAMVFVVVVWNVCSYVCFAQLCLYCRIIDQLLNKHGMNEHIFHSCRVSYLETKPCLVGYLNTLMLDHASCCATSFGQVFFSFQWNYYLVTFSKENIYKLYYLQKCKVLSFQISCLFLPNVWPIMQSAIYLRRFIETP